LRAGGIDPISPSPIAFHEDIEVTCEAPNDAYLLLDSDEGSRTSTGPRSMAAFRAPRPGAVSHHARYRRREEMGTLGSGDHHREVKK
jgi:hypothetical protein